ncbi:hypothetical protein DF186_23760, partial [Enterococcus hirae]
LQQINNTQLQPFIQKNHQHNTHIKQPNNLNTNNITNFLQTKQNNQLTQKTNQHHILPNTKLNKNQLNIHPHNKLTNNH